MNKSTQILNGELHSLLDFAGLVVINCWADWCSRCHNIGPLIDQIHEEYKDSIKLFRIDIDENPNIANQLGLLGINSVPITFIFKGGTLVEKIMGAVPYEKFAEAVDKHLA